MAPATPPTPTALLTALDRCDRCSAQAYVQVRVSIELGTLLFCAHHADESLPAIEAKYPNSEIVVDDRTFLAKS